MAVGGHETGVGEHPGGHEGGTDQERPTATPAVNEDERKDGHDDVDDILDGGGNKVVVALESGHTEDVGNLHAVNIRFHDTRVLYGSRRLT